MQNNCIYSCKMKFLIVICTALCFSVEASNLPSYISKCCATDPDADKCYLSQAKLIIPIILRGDKRYNLMNLTPYMQAQMTLYNGKEGKFVLNSVRLSGLDTIKVDSLNFNFDTGKYKGTYYLDNLNLVFTYNMGFSDTPFRGFGCGSIKITRVNLTHTFDIVPHKNGHAFCLNADVKFTAADTVYNLENLCKSAEEYLRNNYEKVKEMCQPNICRILSAVMTSPFRAFSELIKLQTGVGFGKDCKKCS